MISNVNFSIFYLKITHFFMYYLRYWHTTKCDNNINDVLLVINSTSCCDVTRRMLAGTCARSSLWSKPLAVCCSKNTTKLLDRSYVKWKLDFPSRRHGRGRIDDFKAAHNRRKRSREVQVCSRLAASRLASLLWMLTFFLLRKFSPPLLGSCWCS